MYGSLTKLGAKVLLDNCLALKPEDDVLVVTDHNLIELADFLAAEAESYGAETTVINMKPRDAPGTEPPKPVAQAMKVCDVLLMPTSFTLAPSIARAEAQDAGARILSLGGYHKGILESKALMADFQGIKPVVEQVAARLTESSKAHISTLKGTDLKMTLGDRHAHALHNICHTLGTMGSPPDVEAYIAPMERSAEGVVILDGAINLPEFGLLADPVKLEVEQGKITEISGNEEARRFKALLESYRDPEMYLVAELGIGLNPEAELVGDPLIDEGVFGTAHIALGLNYTYGGAIKEAKSHIDCVFREPIITLDGEVLNIDL